MNLDDLNLDDEVTRFLENQKDFSIDRVSQEGGNGDIFFGFHNIFGMRIALKIYYGNETTGSHYEPRTLSKIDHPNILRVRDAKRIGRNHSYFMTDEIDGGDLGNFHESGVLDLRDSLNIIHGVLNGLSELHKDSISIVHRDIKPKNILIYNSTKLSLISDFGSVKHLDRNLGSVTGSNTTMIYKPKEVFLNNSYTKQSDIYQVGVTMFQLLGGRFPGAYFDWLNDGEQKKFTAIRNCFEQDTFINKVIEKRVTKNELLNFSSLPDYINSSLLKIAKKATHPSLAVRYENSAAFMGDLYRVQKRLINWKEETDFLYAENHKGSKYRVSLSNKGYITEKLGSGNRWRKTGESSPTRRTQIDSIS